MLMILVMPSYESVIYYDMQRMHRIVILRYVLSSHFLRRSNHVKNIDQIFNVEMTKRSKREFKSIKVHGRKVANNFVDSRT